MHTYDLPRLDMVLPSLQVQALSCVLKDVEIRHCLTFPGSVFHSKEPRVSCEGGCVQVHVVRWARGHEVNSVLPDCKVTRVGR